VNGFRPAGSKCNDVISRSLKLLLLLICAFASSGCYATWALRDSEFGKSRVINETFNGVRGGYLADDGTFALEVGAHYDARGGSGSAKYLIAGPESLNAFATDTSVGDAVLSGVPIDGEFPWRVWPGTMEPADLTDFNLAGEIGPIVQSWPVTVVTMDAEQEGLARQGIFRPARRRAQVGPISVPLENGNNTDITFGDFYMEGRAERNYWKTALYPFAAAGAGVADLVFMPVWALYNLPPGVFSLFLL